MRTAHVLSKASLGSTALALSLGLGLGLLATSGSGCKVQSIFTCVDDTNCESHGEGGICEANSFCTFPDAACPTGKRWHDRAGDLAGDCFEVEGGSGSGDGSGGTGDTGGDDDAPAEDSGAASNPMTSADSSTGEAPDPSTGASAEDDSGDGNASTGAAGACDGQYGGATDYMFCAEDVDSCTFVTTTNMAMTCAAVCTSFGGTCITGHTNDAEPCTAVADVGCEDMTSNDMICVCSNGA